MWDITLVTGINVGHCVSQTQPSPEAIRRLAYEISDMKASNALKVKLLSSKATLPVKELAWQQDTISVAPNNSLFQSVEGR